MIPKNISLYARRVSVQNGYYLCGGNGLKPCVYCRVEGNYTCNHTEYPADNYRSRKQNELIYVLTIPLCTRFRFFKTFKIKKALLSSLDAINIRRTTKRVQC